MKKLLSIFITSTLLFGATNLTALAGGGMSKPRTDTAVTSPLHTQEEIESIFSNVRFALWSDWCCRALSRHEFPKGHDDVHYSTYSTGDRSDDIDDITLFAGNTNIFSGLCDTPPVNNAVRIDTHVEGVSASFIPFAFYNSDRFQKAYTDCMRDSIEFLAGEGVITLPEASDEESFFEDAYGQLQEYFNGNTAAKLEGYPAWLAKQFINKFNLRQKLQQFDIPKNPNCYFLIIEEHSQNKSEGSTFHIELLNGSKLFNDRVCNEALYTLEDLIYARI